MSINTVWFIIWFSYIVCKIISMGANTGGTCHAYALSMQFLILPLLLLSVLSPKGKPKAA